MINFVTKKFPKGARHLLETFDKAGAGIPWKSLIIRLGLGN
jgi:hypothetical protein